MNPTQSLAGWLSLIAMMAVGLGFFSWTAYQRMRLLLAGQPIQRFDQLGKRLIHVLSLALGQKKMFKEPLAGLMHALIFWGFCVFSVRTVTLFGQGLYHGFSFPVLGWFHVTWGFYLLSKDIFAVLVSVGVLYWVLWRLFGSPKRISSSLEAYFILGMILTLMVTDLFVDGAEIAHGSGAAAYASWLPFSSKAPAQPTQ